MTRRQKRKIALVVLLALLLALLGAYYMYYRSTQKLTFDIAPVSGDVIEAPQYLYSFSGSDQSRMQRPIGVLVDDEDVYVVDSARHVIGVYNEDGELQRSFGTSETLVPLYVAKNPVNGNLYVSDRRARTIHIFKTDGSYVGQFDPKLPKDQLPDFDTGGVQWAPVALDFAPDGTMYVTEILNGHRLLIFDKTGKFTRSVGTVGIVLEAASTPEVFQFPNGVVFEDGLVYVTDSNNRRVQVFKKNGDFDRIIVTQGLPRGIDFLQPFSGDDANTKARFVIVDTLAHDGTIWSTSDENIVNFGEQGVLEGQFSYPNDVSVMDDNNKIYISDTANGRVQVWGWPAEVSPVPVPRLPQNWWPCLLPLLLLPLLLLLRKKRFFATEDFVDAMVQFEDVHTMPKRRRAWLISAEGYELVKDVEQDEVRMGELFSPQEHSESDTRALMDKLEIPYEMAKVLALAKRAHVFTTESQELRRLAKVLEIDVVDRREFLERFSDKVKNAEPKGPISE